MELIKDNVKVEWVELGEGWAGEYDPDDPDDEELLRFDVSIFQNGEWEDVISYCTQFPVKSTKEQQEKALAYLMDHFYEPLTKGDGIKHIAAEMSWISLETIGEK